MIVKTLAIDLAKETFYVCGKDAKNQVVLSKKINTTRLRKLLLDLHPCDVYMEACGGANYWGRLAQTHGHRVKLISPQHVKPYVTSGQKNDRNDCLAILEAAQRPGQLFKMPKSEFCQKVQRVLKTREHFVRQKVSLTNHLRGLLLEEGIAIPKGDHHLRKKIQEILSFSKEDAEHGLALMLEEMSVHLVHLEEQIESLSQRILSFSKEQPVIKKLTAVPGVGPISAAWFFAHFGDGSGYKNGRQAAACLGLVPRQNSTGGRSRLLGITKQGNVSVRTALIHGGRSYVRAVAIKGASNSYTDWVQKLNKTKGINKTAVAVANKNARMMWAMLHKGVEYKMN